MLREMTAELLPRTTDIPTEFAWLVAWALGSFVSAVLDSSPDRVFFLQVFFVRRSKMRYPRFRLR